MSIEKSLDQIAISLDQIAINTTSLIGLLKPAVGIVEPPINVVEPFEEPIKKKLKLAKEEKPPKDDLTIDSVRKAAKNLIDKKPGGVGFAGAQTILKKFGAVKMADLAPSKYATVIAELKKEAGSK